MQDALGGVQSVLVLGGSSEIALATLRRLVADRTRTVVLAARDPRTLSDTARELHHLGATTIETVAFDAADTDTHAGFVDDIFQRVARGGFADRRDRSRSGAEATRGDGDIDLVLVAFGILGDQESAERDVGVAAEIAQVNYVGAVSVTIPIAARLKAQGHGTIVALSSVAGERARRANFVYGSSKAGLDAFFQGLGDSLVGTGVHVMVVRPGFVHTKMTAGLEPAPLATTPDAVADAIVRGIARRAHTVWVPPALRFVMSALRHAPKAIWRKLPL